MSEVGEATAVLYSVPGAHTVIFVHWVSMPLWHGVCWYVPDTHDVQGAQVGDEDGTGSMLLVKHYRDRGCG